MTAREKREKKRRFRMLATVLVSVVALIECLVLLSFTTYSWIESSSSLIISSGNKGVKLIPVADKLNYQVLLSLDASGVAELNSNRDDSGFYRTVEHFKFAKTTSPDGKTFYFTRPDSTYRCGDTTDFNTSYTLIDFELKNTTQQTKGFYFRSADIFSSSTAGMDTTLANGTTEVQDVIYGAMRISVQKNNSAPEIFSVGGHNSNCPVNTSGTVTPYTCSSHAISGYIYDSENAAMSAVFESTYVNRDVTDKVSVRIWFDQYDTVYTGLSPADRTAVDNVLYAADINMNIAFINDDISYDRIYFDDFALSDKVNNKFMTRENNAYGMFLHVYNSNVDHYVNYPMSIAGNSDNEAVRWVTAVPIPNVVKNEDTQYLTSTSTDQFRGAYFYYGAGTSANPGLAADGVPSVVVYKWSLTNAIGLNAEETAFTCGNRYRNLGAVRTSANSSQAAIYNYVSGNSTEPVNGFIQCTNPTGSDASDPMTMVSFRDRTTGLNSSTAYNYAQSNFVTEAKSQVQISDETVDFSKIYYYDVPEGATKIVIDCNYDSGNKATQTVDIENFDDGQCYRLTGEQDTDNKQMVEVVSSIILPTAFSEGAEEVKRVYFYNQAYNSAPDWSTPHIYHNYTGNSGLPGDEMEQFQAPSDKRFADRVYINCIASTAGGSTQAATAKQTVQLHYSAAKQLWQAYVPASWLSAGNTTYFHFNAAHEYYDDSTENVRWALGTASMYNAKDYVYTALGYTNAQALTALTGGTGVGTWSDVRTVSFNTDLIDSDVSGAYVYKVGFGSGDYPMSPDALGFTFTGYVPLGAATSGNVRFTSYSAYNSSTVTGYWYPGSFNAADTTYYAVTKSSTDSNAVRGHFHLAVFVDGTYENLVYDTLTDGDGMGTLKYTLDGGTTYTTLMQDSSTANTPATDTNRIGKTRWYVPVGAADTFVDFIWTPYTASATTDLTEFTYTHYISDGIYCIVAEAS